MRSRWANRRRQLGYATNIEPEASDFGAGFDANGQRDATANDYPFRVRGLPGGVGRDFVESAVPVDLYSLFCPADGRTA